MSLGANLVLHQLVVYYVPFTDCRQGPKVKNGNSDYKNPAGKFFPRTSILVVLQSDLVFRTKGRLRREIEVRGLMKPVVGMLLSTKQLPKSCTIVCTMEVKRLPTISAPSGVLKQVG